MALPCHCVKAHGDDVAAMYNALLTAAHPPQMMRLPGAWPESWFIRATPTSAHICLALS